MWCACAARAIFTSYSRSSPGNIASGWRHPWVFAHTHRPKIALSDRCFASLSFASGFSQQTLDVWSAGSRSLRTPSMLHRIDGSAIGSTSSSKDSHNRQVIVAIQWRTDRLTYALSLACLFGPMKEWTNGWSAAAGIFLFVRHRCVRRLFCYFSKKQTGSADA